MRLFPRSSALCLLVFSVPLWLILPADLQTIEIRVRIRLGPEADLAGLGEGLVLGFQVFLAVEGAFDLGAGHLNGQRVPLAGGNLEVFLRGELHALAG